MAAAAGCFVITLTWNCPAVQKSLDRFLIPDARQMVHELTEATGPGFLKLNDAVCLLLCICFVLM
jgi:hypothetical protein